LANPYDLAAKRLYKNKNTSRGAIFRGFDGPY
jgi:hypothetical protein